MGSKRNTKKRKYIEMQREYEDNLFGSNETFAFIAGYTSGGFAYGITWEEMEEIECRDKELLGEEHSYHGEEIDLPFD